MSTERRLQRFVVQYPPPERTVTERRLVQRIAIEQQHEPKIAAHCASSAFLSDFDGDVADHLSKGRFVACVLAVHTSQPEAALPVVVGVHVSLDDAERQRVHFVPGQMEGDWLIQSFLVLRPDSPVGAPPTTDENTGEQLEPALGYEDVGEESDAVLVDEALLKGSDPVAYINTQTTAGRYVLYSSWMVQDDRNQEWWFEDFRIIAHARRVAWLIPLTKSGYNGNLKIVGSDLSIQLQWPFEPLSVSVERITTTGLRQLLQLRNLRLLSLARTPVGDKDITLLATCESLIRSLDLSYTKVTDDGLRCLASYTALTSLSLEGTSISDAGLVHVAQLSCLTSLNLSSTTVTDEGLTHLVSLRNLATLALRETQTTDAGWLSLACLKHLASPIVDRTKCDGATAEAIAEASEAIRLNTNHVIDAYAQRAEAFLRLGRLAFALSDANESLRRKPENAFCLKVRAECYCRQGDLERAIKDASEAIRWDKSNVALLELRAELYRRTGNPELAISDADEAIRLCPSSIAARRTRGSARHQIGDLANALTDFTELLRLDPGNEYIRCQLEAVRRHM